jgi:hypothetical protein
MAAYLRAGMRETMILTVSGKIAAPKRSSKRIACFRTAHKPGTGTTATAPDPARARLPRRPAPDPAPGMSARRDRNQGG